MDAVSSHPKDAGTPVLWVSPASNCRSQPLLLVNGFSRTPKNTLPSGPIVGDAVPRSERAAGIPFLGSVNAMVAFTRKVVLSSARRYPRRLPTSEEIAWAAI